MPGVRRVTDLLTECVLAHVPQRDPEWVSLWAAEPGEVQQCLLDMLAPIELQLDQFHFERGATPPRR